MAPRKIFNPRTGRWQDATQTTSTTVDMNDYWDNARAETDRKSMTRVGGPVREGKDSPLRGRSTPTQMTRQPVTTTPTPNGDPVTTFLEQYKDDPMFPQILAALTGGSGSGGPSRADRQRAARTVKQAGRQAKKDYTRLGEEGFARTMGEAEKYYGGRETTARKQIDDATKAFLQSLVAPTAYVNTPLPNMQVQQQGLGEALGAYGATGNLARQQQLADQGELDFASQLASRTMGQLNTAQTNYLDAIRNAGLGAQAAARTGLTQNTESMRGMTRAQADATRQELLRQGIEALISGNQNAANAYL
jgi:hypothetical protein